ncbi:MAG: FtsK/SpoIIIE domain-containing protein, partial [Microbacterium gubbeenense]
MSFAPVETSAAAVTRRLAEPLELPDLPAAPARRPFPLVASIVPVVGAVVMWQVTGSVFMLWFAALGPFMAIASLVDGARGAKRERRKAEHELAVACERVRKEVDDRHREERALRQAASPDVARAVSHDGWLWRRQGTLVVGTGRAESIVRVTGGEGDEAERLRGDAEGLDRAPVTVEWAGGVCVRG